MNLKGTQTEKNLKDAFAGESQANRRYLYFAAKASFRFFSVWVPLRFMLCSCHWGNLD